MTSTRTKITRDLALLSVAALASITVGVAAQADSGSPTGKVAVVNTETVKVDQSADGGIRSKQVYEQLSMTGKGRVELDNPVSTQGLRNLDGFGSIKVQHGDQVVDTTVDGQKTTRSLSDYTKALPLKVEASYTLDGKAVKPGDVVGKTGRLAAFFTVTNLTGRTQDVTFPNGTGGTITRSVSVPVPMVGSLTTTAPPGFTNVRSTAANVAGDGHGGTTLSFTMTLFPPIGSTTAKFGYTADITDGVVPPVDVVALPVNPLQSPTFKGAAASYQGGADTGAALVDGAVKVDDNLLKLRDGSAQLLAGLVKLRTGADQLDAGLSGQAAPGAKKLAGGASDLHDGLGRLKDGSAQLVGGAAQVAGGNGDLAKGTRTLAAGSASLADGTGSALAGSRSLSSGLKQISGGLGLLADQLPSASAGVSQLQGGIAQLLAGLGDETDPRTLIGGLAALDTGLGNARTGAGAVKDGLTQLATSTSQGLPAAKGGADQIAAGLRAAANSINPGDADALAGGIGSLKAYCNQVADPTQRATCNGTVDAIVAKVNGATADSSKSKLTALKNGLNGAVTNLDAVSAGVGSAIAALNTQLIPGVGQIYDGLDQQALPGVAQLRTGALAVKGGLVALDTGLGALADGVTSAVDGVLQLQAGSQDAYRGSVDLTHGLGRIDSGADRLADGLTTASSGAGKLAAGSRRLASGAKELDAGEGKAKAGARKLAAGSDRLAGGISTAADGSKKIAGGLGTATDGAEQLPAGATKLSNRGTKKIVAAGEATTAQYGELAAVIDAGSKRATTDDMAYGAPTDASGFTAYSYTISGVDGEGGKNLTRALGGLALLGAGGGVIGLRRRLR